MLQLRYDGTLRKRSSNQRQGQGKRKGQGRRDTLKANGKGTGKKGTGKLGGSWGEQKGWDMRQGRTQIDGESRASMRKVTAKAEDNLNQIVGKSEECGSSGT